MFDNNGINIEKPSLIGKLCDSIISVGGKRQKMPAGIELILDRFGQLLEGHNLSLAQLLKLVPSEWSWHLGILGDRDQLVAELTPARLAWLAETFGVQLAWLEGQDVPIYRWPAGYKQPQEFVGTLDEMGWLKTWDGSGRLRITVFAADYSGDNGPLGDFVITFSYPIAEWDNGETVVYRHVVFDSLMNWEHWPCRRDAKALARWFSMGMNLYGQVPIVRVDRDTVLALAEGREFVGPHVPVSAAGYDHFEYRVMRLANPRDKREPGESVLAIETEELSEVLSYMVDCEIEK